MADNIILFPHTNGSNGSAEVRVVPYPARARVVVEHGDHTLDAWDQIVRLVPNVHALIDIVLSLGNLIDEQQQMPADEWIQRYWDLVEHLVTTRKAIDVAALKRDYGPGASPVPVTTISSLMRSRSPSKTWTGSSLSSRKSPLRSISSSGPCARQSWVMPPKPSASSSV